MPINELTDDFSVKVFILYLLKNINEPLEFETVNDIVLQDDFVNYFNFSICFAELLEAGQILEVKHNDKKLYTISPSGIEAVKNVEITLYSEVKEKALRSALRILALKRTGNRVTSSLTPDGKGYTLVCRIEDNEKVLLSTQVYLTDGFFAENMKANFDERAEIIYKGILALLSGEVNFIFDE